MKVKELIKQLQELNEPEKEVYFDDEEWGIRPVSEVDNRPYEEEVVLRSYN